MSAPAPAGDIWPEPHVVVLASAGTGKTFRLTNRFIALVHGGAEPASILATTFTRKAAGEILERTLTRLADGAAGEGAGKELALLKRHVDPRIDGARCAELLGLICASLHRLSVLTIDALLARIVAAYGAEAGIGPEWRILEDAEDESLRSRAVVDVLAAGDQAQTFAFLHMLHAGGFGRKVHEAVMGAMDGVYSAYRRTRPFPGVWEVIGPEETVDGAARERAVAALNEAPRHFSRTKSTGRPPRRWEDSHDRLVEAVRDERWETVLGGGLSARIAAGETTFDRQPISAELVRAYTPIVRFARAAMLQKLKERNAATVALAARFDAAYSGTKRSAGAFRFDDLAPLVMEGLGESGVGGAPGGLEHLYFRLDAKFRHVLLDEFQDTSLDQFRVLRPMVEEILAGEGAGGAGLEGAGPVARSVFCVGDEKQSLYSWREAEPALLPSLAERWPQLSTRRLQESHRSSQAILDAVNAVFGSIGSNAALAPEAGDAARAWGERFGDHTSSDAGAPGLVRLVVAPDAGAGAPKRERELAAIRMAAARVREIVEAAPHATIGVLLRTNRNIPHLMYELAERGRPIHASQEGGSPLMDSPPVATAVSLMHLADHPGDSAARFHVAASPLGAAVGLTDPDDGGAADRAAADLRRQLLETGYAATLSRLLAACAGSMDARGYRRFRQLVEFAQTFDDGAGDAVLRPSEFCRRARKAAVEEPGGATVRVMSIHKSKGLEFDAVILPDLDRRWEIKPGSVLLDRPEPLGPIAAATAYPNKELRAADPRLAAMHAQQLQRQSGEELSGLYVGMTRAKKYLEMIVLPGKPPKEGGAAYPLSAAGVLHAALAPGKPLGPETELWCTAHGACRDDRSPTAWAGKQRSPEAPAPAPVELPLDVPKPARRPLARARTRSPSSLEGAGVIRIADLLRLDESPALGRGTLYHEWFRLVEWLDDGAPSDRDLLAAADAAGFAEPEARTHLDSYRAALARPAVAAALGRARYSARPAGEVSVRREWAFAASDADDAGRPAILRGQFDRVVVGRDGRGRALWAEVLDYKTDRIDGADGELLADRTQHYLPQMLAYRRAAAQMLGLDAGAVAATLLFVEPGVCVDVAGPGYRLQSAGI